MAVYANSTPVPERMLELERLRGILRSVEIEANDARILSTTVSNCIDHAFRVKVPAGQAGSEVFMLTDEESDVLRFNAYRAEASVKLVCGAIEEAARVLPRLRGRFVVFHLCEAGKVPAPSVDPLHDLITEYAAERALNGGVPTERMDAIWRRLKLNTPATTTFDGVMAALRLADEEMNRSEYKAGHALVCAVMDFLSDEVSQ